MYHLLVVDDEEKIRGLIRKYAEFEGHRVTEAADGMEAVRLCRENTYDIIILDIMMPELDGFSACREIRKTCDTPVIMLSARSEELDRIHGFSLGVDDYVSKPFSPRELMMRIAAIRKRTSSAAGPVQPDVFLHGGLCVDFTARKLTVDGKRVDLSPKEYELLFFLVRNRNIALTREKLICEVWGYDFTGDERTLDTHIKLLRKRLGPYAGCIVTMRGVGYRFEA